MATETQTVTGVITRPDGTSLSAGIVRFTLSRVDPDTTNDEVVIPPVVDAVIGNDGSISVDLWPNTLGFYGTVYKVHVIRMAEAGQQTTLIGRIQVGEAGPYELTDLLVAGDSPAEDVFYSVITEAQYNEIIAAAETAEDAAADAALYDGPKVDTFDDLDAVTGAQVGTGDFIRVIEGGAILQGVASGETITTAGGAKLVVVRGPEFNTRSDVTLGEIAKYPDGTIGYAAGNQYTANSSLTGAASDGNDVGVDGIEATGPLSGGASGSVLSKASGTDYDTEWVELGSAADEDVSAFATAAQGTKADNAIPNPASVADGDILYRTGGAWARLPKGTDGQVLSLASGVPAWVDASGGGWTFESSPITLTANSVQSVAHGLGVAPTDMRIDLVCTVANSGYAVGDRIAGEHASTGALSGRGLTLYTAAADEDTYIKIATGSQLRGRHAAGTSEVALAFTDWDVIVRAR